MKCSMILPVLMVAGNGLSCATVAQKTIDISGWTFESAGTSFSEIYTVAAGVTINPGQHLVFGPGVGRGSFSSNLQNGGSATDGLRLMSGTVVQDTLLYDSNNINSLLDDRGSRSGPFAPDVADGSSLSRSPDCVEVNNHGGDFVETVNLTPGAVNVTSGGGGPQSCDNSYQVVINEIITRILLAQMAAMSGLSCSTAAKMTLMFRGGYCRLETPVSAPKRQLLEGTIFTCWWLFYCW